MSYKKYYETLNMKNADITLVAVCYTQDTSYGFHHCCEYLTIIKKDNNTTFELNKKVFRQYYNRTWERYRFQSVILSALAKLEKSMPSEVYKNAESLIK